MCGLGGKVDPLPLKHIAAAFDRVGLAGNGVKLQTHVAGQLLLDLQAEDFGRIAGKGASNILKAVALSVAVKVTVRR